MRWAVLTLVVCLSCLWNSGVASAHPLAPLSLTIVQQADPTIHQISLRRGVALVGTIEAELPKGCEIQRRERIREGNSIVRDELTVKCASSLAGQTVSLRGLGTLSTGALAFARFQNGQKARAVLTPEAPAFVIPVAESSARVFIDYTKLGIEHLITGTDHLVFVLGLCLLVNRLRRVALTLTAFTLGHSVTLALAALELVRLPSAPVELVIALSILVLALELLSTTERAAEGVAPYALALGFGLIHGLGFAGALGETGLAGHALVLSLFAFNLGVEIAQLSLLVALAPLLWWLSRDRTRLVPRVRTACGYAAGALSAMWCIERAAVLF